MPTGTPYNSCIPPYRIRVDDFAASTGSDSEDPPLLHLLTHTHSDHINGLSAKSFGFKVYCSRDAKEMLLRHEVYAERELQALELRAEKIRTYSHLKIDPLVQSDGQWYYNGSRDLLHPLPLNTPTRVELNSNEAVTITLLDANHCPGAVMFLVEGDRGAILHTGDFRAEPWFLESIVHNSFLQPYLSPFGFIPPGSKVPVSGPFNKTLEAIYLDTASVMSPLVIPTKDSATSGLVELMKLFPENVYFFINSWTWGYEDILKAVARAFNSPIHVDRYKFSIYQHLSDPFLGLITTQDPSSTRFHACERFDRCSFVHVKNGPMLSNATSTMGKRVIYVNPVTMDTSAWSAYIDETRSSILVGEEISNLLVPLSRHSTLPELQEFVKLFRPKRVVPNTLDPRLCHLDWACIDRMFSSCLHPSAQALASNAALFRLRVGIASKDQLSAEVQNDGDVALKNLVGTGADVAAQRWADQGKLLKKLSLIRGYLDEEENAIIDTLLGIKRAHGTRSSAEVSSEPPEARSEKGKSKEFVPSRYYGRESEDESDNGLSDDERGRTAHKLFAGLAGIDEKENSWWISSPVSVEGTADDLGEGGLADVILSKGHAEPVRDGASRVNRLTPVTSPIRARRTAQNLHSPSPTPQSKRNLTSHLAQGLIQTPVKTPKPASGSGLSLASPICLLSSSSPDIPKGSRTKGHARSHQRTSTKGHSTRDKLFIFPQPRALIFPASSPHSSSSKMPQDEAANNFIPSSSELSDTGRQKEGRITKVGTPLVSGVSLSKRRRDLAELTVTTSSKKQGQSEAIPPMPPATKKSRVDLSRHNSLFVDSAATNPGALEIQQKSSSLASSAVVDQPSGPAIPVKASSEDTVAVLVPMTEKEELQLKRMEMAHQLAQTYPHLVHPSYWKMRERQLKRFERKRREREAAALAAAADEHADPLTKVSTTSRIPLIRTMTVPSFEPVDDGDGGMNWNRSRELAEEIRKDLKNGRQPSLPVLLCTRSEDSQSDQTQ